MAGKLAEQVITTVMSSILKCIMVFFSDYIKSYRTDNLNNIFKDLHFGLVGLVFLFNGLSTFVGYLMPMLFS